MRVLLFGVQRHLELDLDAMLRWCRCCAASRPFGRNAIEELAQAQTAHWCIKNKSGKDCIRLIHLNSSAGQSEKDEGVLGTGKIGAIVGCVIGQHEANKAGAIGSKDFGLVDERRSSLTIKITGAPMRRMIDWIVGTDETVLDVAIVGFVAILGPFLLTQVPARRDRSAVSVLALRFRALRFAMSLSSHRRGDRVKALFAAVHESGSGALLGHGAMSALSP